MVLRLSSSMASYFASFLILVSLPAIFAQEIIHAKIGVNGTTAVAEIDDYFICATLDWWPQTKCNYNQCPWGNASVINLVRFRDLPLYKITLLVNIESI